MYMLTVPVFDKWPFLSESLDKTVIPFCHENAPQGELYPKSNLKMFCALSQNYQYLKKKTKWLSWSKFSEKPKVALKT